MRIPEPRRPAESPDELDVPSTYTRAEMYEDGHCLHHDCPTETRGGVERCRACQADFDQALAVLDGARERRRP